MPATSDYAFGAHICGSEYHLMLHDPTMTHRSHARPPPTVPSRAKHGGTSERKSVDRVVVKEVVMAESAQHLASNPHSTPREHRAPPEARVNINLTGGCSLCSFLTRSNDELALVHLMTPDQQLRYRAFLPVNLL